MYYMTNTPNQKYRPYYGSDVEGELWFVDFTFPQVLEMNGGNTTTIGALLTFNPTPAFDPGQPHDYCWVCCAYCGSIQFRL